MEAKPPVSNLFYIIAYSFCGGVLGLSIGLFLNDGSGHGLGNLVAIVFWMPIGFLIGFVLSRLILRRLSLKQQKVFSIIAFVIGISISLIIYLMVQADIIDW